MRPVFKHSHKGFSGVLDDLVYGMYRNNSICIARAHVVPPTTAQNTLMGQNTRNLASVYHLASAPYREDCVRYATQYAKQFVKKGKLPPTAFALFNKMLWAWHDQDPEENLLATLNLADVLEKNLPIKSIKLAVEAGLLPAVRGYEAFTNLIA